MDSQQPKMIYPGLWQFPRNSDLCCIYRVPNSLRDVNPEAYTPQLVLIGPLHHSLKSQALKALDRGDDITYTKSMSYLNMEEHKKIYLEKFAERVEGEKTIDGLRRMIEKDEEVIRECYSESTAWTPSQEFVEMVLHDSVFIIEFILRAIGTRSLMVGDPLWDGNLASTVYVDLILLENQLPFFILDKLFGPIIQRMYQQLTFRELIVVYFGFKGKIRNNSTFRHITDLFRCVSAETLPQHEGECKPIEHMYNAEKLAYGGINLKAVGEELSLHVSFENGCLKMPSLTVDDKFETTLRNIMALEQCHYSYDAHVCNYVLFLDCLIDTDKDVDLLVEKGIIKNWIGQPGLVARMVNKLGLGIIEVGSHYSGIAVEVNKYYSNPVKKSKAVLKRVYFRNLWTGTATMAATCLLVMTLVQTVASIIQVIQNAS